MHPILTVTGPVTPPTDKRASNGAAPVKADADADAAPSSTGTAGQNDTDLAAQIARLAEPRPGPDTPAGPRPAFEITILERERAIQAMLARSETDPDA